MKMNHSHVETSLDLDSLRRIGIKEGFSSRLRKKVWPALLHINPDAIEISEEAEPHVEEKQVLLDTRRSFTSCLPSNLSTNSIETHKEHLQYMIAQVLRRNRWLNYYQGYHDIAQLVYQTMGQQLSILVLERMSLLYLRDFMLSTLSPSMSMLRMVHQIIRIADPDYAYSLHDTEPYYAIPALLTWWTHSIDSYASACRLMDFLLSSEPIMIIYTIAAATLSRKEEVTKLALAGDQDMIFLTLSKGIDERTLEEVLLSAQTMFESIKPKQLRHWKSISQHSCLKTFSTRTLARVESPEDFSQAAQHDFEQQEVEIRAEEARKAQQAKSVASSREMINLSILALSVGVLAAGIAWYMQQR